MGEGGDEGEGGGAGRKWRAKKKGWMIGGLVDVRGRGGGLRSGDEAWGGGGGEQGQSGAGRGVGWGRG